jgi:hypothetical protein
MLLKKSPLMCPPVLFAMGAIAVILLIYRFGNIREERLVQKFLDELKAGNFQQAYQTWGPTQGYTYKDFMADWGGNGYFGKIGASRILESKPKERCDRAGRVQPFEAALALWVERRTRRQHFRQSKRCVRRSPGLQRATAGKRTTHSHIPVPLGTTESGRDSPCFHRASKASWGWSYHYSHEAQHASRSESQTFSQGGGLRTAPEYGPETGNTLFRWRLQTAKPVACLFKASRLDQGLRPSGRARGFVGLAGTDSRFGLAVMCYRKEWRKTYRRRLSL